MRLPEVYSILSGIRRSMRDVYGVKLSRQSGMDPNLKLEDWVGQTVDVVIDRPMGTTHPRFPDFVYPINYGYIPGTMAPDGHPIDAYVLGAEYPIKRCSAMVIAVIRRRDDVEDKLVVALSGEWSKASIIESTSFQEQYFDSWVELPEYGRE